MSDSKLIFSQNLKNLIEEKNINQADLSKILGVSESTVGKWILQKAMPRMIIIDKLAEYFQVDKTYFFKLQNSETLNNIKHTKKGVKIPVLGKVVAGIPVEAITDIIDYEEITEDMAKTGEFFALQVKGDSMAPRIRENDVVIVRKQSTVENKDVAIVLVNGSEATIKEVQIQENGITLIGWNPAVYTPHFYSAKEIKTLPIQIIGKVVELRGKF